MGGLPALITRGTVFAPTLWDRSLIVEGNPLTNIAATRNIRMVIQGGEVMDTTYDPNWVNPVPRPTEFSPR